MGERRRGAAAGQDEPAALASSSIAEVGVWRLPARVALLWHIWDEEAVVYNTGSGQTHLLDALSAAILREIEAAPATTRQLADNLAARFGLDREALARRVEDVSSRLEELGLVERDRR